MQSHGWSVRPEGPETLPRRRCGYLHFDSLTHSPANLRFLVTKFGAARVAMGSDYPFDVGKVPRMIDSEPRAGRWPILVKLDAASVGETMEEMRLTLATIFLALFAAALSTVEADGLSGTLEQQRQNLSAQQGEVRRENERQRESLQQQQERNLQFQLLQRQQPVTSPAPPNCVQVGGSFSCR